MPEVNSSDWDQFTAERPETHLLQTSAWGDLKSGFGWSAVRVVAAPEGGTTLPFDPLDQNLTGAQVLFRRLPLGLSFAYIPKGPVYGSSALERLLPELDKACRRRRAVFMKVEPDLWECAGATQEQITPPAGFRPTSHSIQPPRTLVVDLEGSEEQILNRMKQKTRYNIRLALKKGVVVRPSADLELFYKLMESTGERDQFGVHSRGYYQRTYELFHPRGECELLVAELDNQPLAALMLFARGRRAWYFYGASVEAHREAMPAYALQWEAMRWARAHGCRDYDLWGVPDAGEETLEANFTGRSDGLWGVYRFKRGFGGELRRAVGPWDRLYSPFFYQLYRLWMGRTL